MFQGSVWSRLGAQVTLVEFLGNIGGFGIDLEVAKTLQRSLTKQGLKFLLQTKVVGATREGSNIKVNIEDMKKGKQEEVRLSLTFSNQVRFRFLVGILNKGPIFELWIICSNLI